MAGGALGRATASRLCAHAAIFLMVLGVKLALIARYSAPHPYWDSWHVEGAALYKPFLTGTLTLADLFAPASEHRPLVLRLYDLTLLTLNGQWDVNLQMVVNAIIFAALGCIFFWLLSREAGPAGSIMIATGVTVAFALPFAAENTLNGHHAGWFFFYLFTIVGLWLVLARPPFSRFWLAGYALLVGAYFALFAGVISTATAAGGLVLQMIAKRRYDHRTALAAALLALTFVVGMVYEPRFPGQATVQAASWQAFMTALGYALVWPHFEIGPLGFLLQVPALLLAILLVVGTVPYSSTRVFVVSLAVWVWLQAVGMSYARGVTGIAPVPRYMEILAFGLLAGLTAAIVLVNLSKRWWIASLSVALLGIWLVSVGLGLEHRTRDAYIGFIPAKGQMAATQDANLRGYVATGNRVYLDDKSTADIAYYGGADTLAGYLTDPVIRSILAASIREPLPTRWQAVPADAVTVTSWNAPSGVTSDEGAVSTYTSAGAQAQGQIESAWIAPPERPFLQFRLIGDWQQPGVSVTLVTESGEESRLQPDGAPGVQWATAEIASPRRTFRIRVVDASATGWVGVSPPREMGPLSYYAGRLQHHAGLLYRLGLASALIFIVLQVWLLLRPEPVKDSTWTSPAY